MRRGFLMLCAGLVIAAAAVLVYPLLLGTATDDLTLPADTEIHLLLYAEDASELLNTILAREDDEFLRPVLAYLGGQLNVVTGEPAELAQGPPAREGDLAVSFAKAQDDTAVADSIRAAFADGRTIYFFGSDLTDAVVEEFFGVEGALTVVESGRALGMAGFQAIDGGDFYTLSGTFSGMDGENTPLVVGALLRHVVERASESVGPRTRTWLRLQSDYEPNLRVPQRVYTRMNHVEHVVRGERVVGTVQAHTNIFEKPNLIPDKDLPSADVQIHLRGFNQYRPDALLVNHQLRGNNRIGDWGPHPAAAASSAEVILSPGTIYTFDYGGTTWLAQDASLANNYASWHLDGGCCGLLPNPTVFRPATSWVAESGVAGPGLDVEHTATFRQRLKPWNVASGEQALTVDHILAR